MNINKKKYEFDLDIKEELLGADRKDEIGLCSRKNYSTKEDYVIVYEKASKIVNEKGQRVYGKEIETVKDVPANMACFASSSRVIVQNFDCEHEIIPEKRLWCGIPHAYANLDGMYREKKDGYRCYIEAKCHEIFDSHQLEWSSAYSDKLKSLGFKNVSTRDDCFRINREVLNLDNDRLRFDVKQFICHLLGIANTNSNKEKTKLVYLLYVPENVFVKYKEEYDRFEKEMDCVMQSHIIRDYLNDNNISIAIWYKKTLESKENNFEEKIVYLSKK